MAHGKETPRQKMIGMMYLVLTAMLALNVSKEVLNAFILVDEGLVTTTENFAAKNDGMYSTFAQEAELNPVKAGEWKAKADDVKQKSDELFAFMHECKTEILSKKEEEAIIEGSTDINWDEVDDRANMDHPAEVMMVRGKAAELKAKIEEHREFLLSLIDDKEKYSGTVEAIDAILTTELPDVTLERSGKKVTPTWENTYFEQLPLASVITLLSNMQANVRNAEAEMIDFLLDQIEAGDIGFNAIRAVVMPERSLVFPGETYRAKVFLAAYDSTKAPVVTLDNGSVLEVDGGEGVYEHSSNTLGIKTWGGVITLENDGSNIVREFEASYEIAEPNATISATGMNVLFRGIKNPIEISVGNVPESAVSVQINSPHSIKPVGPGGEYVVRPGSQGNTATISVFANISGSNELMKRDNFRIEKLPDPIPSLPNYEIKSGRVSMRKSDLMRLEKLECQPADFFFKTDDAEFVVNSFTISYTDNTGVTGRKTSNSSGFNVEMRTAFSNMLRGQRVYIEDITATGPDGVRRNLSDIIAINIQ